MTRTRETPTNPFTTTNARRCSRRRDAGQITPAPSPTTPAPAEPAKKEAPKPPAPRKPKARVLGAPLTISLDENLGLKLIDIADQLKKPVAVVLEDAINESYAKHLPQLSPEMMNMLAAGATVGLGLWASILGRTKPGIGAKP